MATLARNFRAHTQPSQQTVRYIERVTNIVPAHAADAADSCAQRPPKKRRTTPHALRLPEPARSRHRSETSGALGRVLPGRLDVWTSSLRCPDALSCADRSSRSRQWTRRRRCASDKVDDRDFGAVALPRCSAVGDLGLAGHVVSAREQTIETSNERVRKSLRRSDKRLRACSGPVSWHTSGSISLNARSLDDVERWHTPALGIEPSTRPGTAMPATGTVWRAPCCTCL